jgi:hypothetical protein
MMLEFIRIYRQWVVATSEGVDLKENTPKHIVDIFNKIKSEKEKERNKGIIVD